MSKIDWSKPIICAENGARLVIDSDGPDKDGDHRCKPIAPYTWPNGGSTPYWFTPTGKFSGGGYSWTVTNASAAEAALSAARAAGHTDEAIAAAIAALPEPVDPLLAMAREAAARFGEADCWGTGYLEELRAGDADSNEHIQSALIALRMAKEQGWEPK